MTSTFHGLETSKRGLYASQTAIQTTGHNIANANTVGYSRQRVDFKASTPIEAIGLSRSTAPGQLGTGVDFSDITRLREAFLDDQFRDQNQSYGEWTTRDNTMEKLEAIINEPSDYGIRSVADQFWNAWQDLSGQPDNLTARAVLLQKASAMTDAFNDISQKLTALNSDLEESLKIKLGSSTNDGEINILVKQIAGLNNEIFRIERLGDSANDLRDQRDLLTDKLSKIVNIQVKEEQKGYYITIPNEDKTLEIELVQGKDVKSTFDFSNLDTNITSTSGATTTLRAMVSGGEVKGYLESINEVNTMKDQLNTMAKGIITMVNDKHKAGYALDNSTNISFFSGTDASDMEVAITDPNLVATSASLDGGNVIKGDNSVAIAISKLRYANDPSLNGSTPDEYFRSMIGQLGVKAQESTRQAENQRILVDQVDNRRQSISGVSLDEEMADLIKYQHAYNGSARMITTIDEMLDKVINGMGRVGR